MTDDNSINISEWLLICATVAGPILAVQAQKIVEKVTDKRRRKIQVFYSLMATRAARLSAEHVQALNMIDILFTEKKVIEAWREYHDILSEQIDQNSDAFMTTWVTRKDEKFIELLYSMGNALGFKFDRLLLKRGVYTPRAHGAAEIAQLSIRDSLVKILSGQQPIPMAVTSFPVSEDAMKKQEQVQDALLKSLSGDRPIKISIEDKKK